MSLVAACRSLALSTWLLSFCFVHLLCLDFTVAEKEEWYTAFVNITYTEPASLPAAPGSGGRPELRSEKTECGRYGEHSPKQDARGEVVLASSAHDRLACDPNTKFAAPTGGKHWIALIPKGNCTYRDKIRTAFLQNASAVVIFNVGSSTNETITMSHAGRRAPVGARTGTPRPPVAAAAAFEVLDCGRMRSREVPPSPARTSLGRNVPGSWLESSLGCAQKASWFPVTLNFCSESPRAGLCVRVCVYI